MADFHFIRPWWLAAVILLFIALRLLKRIRIAQSGWQQFLPKHLRHLLVGQAQVDKGNSLWLPFLLGCISIIALAGPTWQKQPQPVFQVNRGTVLLMDMSYSMYATDLSPNRLTRARFKAIDLLDSINEGDIGLVAYAGDAFVISPLTQDIRNIKLLLPSLTPEIMPVLGSNPLAALSLANNMLKAAGHVQGDIYWFTDGVELSDRQDIIDWARKHGHRLNILGIGTNQGAPITLANGELMKDQQGAIVIPTLPASLLATIASHANGKYHTLVNDSADLNALINRSGEQDQKQQQESQSFGDQWQEFGPYLVVLMLPFVLGYFRRGNLFVILPLLLLVPPMPNAHASLWQDLWHTTEQQAQQHFDQQQYQQAASQFSDPMWQGSAYYKAGDYQKAVDAFEQANGAQAKYNQGNALAKLQKYDEAIAAYQQALAQDPSMQQAADNKALLEQLKQQQENQQQQDQDQQQDQQQTTDSPQDNQQASDSAQDSTANQAESQQSTENQAEQNKSQQTADQQQQQQNSEQQQQAEQAQQQTPQTAAEQAEPQQQPTNGEAQPSALTAAEQQKQQEAEQKYQQLLNKVTDDPYLLLRNKMQLEYQKRRQNGELSGVKKKW